MNTLYTRAHVPRRSCSAGRASLPCHRGAREGEGGSEWISHAVEHVYMYIETRDDSKPACITPLQKFYSKEFRISFKRDLAEQQLI